jgi:AAA domain
MSSQEAASKFLRDVFASSTTGPVFLTSLPNADAPESEVPRQTMTRNPRAIETFVRECDRANRGLFFCVSTLTLNASTRCKETVSELTGLHADLDYEAIDTEPEHIQQALRQLALLPSKVVSSGRGLHCYWHFKEALSATPENVEQVERLLRRLADHLAGDPKVCEIARLMRLPGTHNTKEGAWLKVEVVDDRPARYDPVELEEWLGEAVPILRRKAPAKSNGGGDGNPFQNFAGQNADKPPIDVEQRLAAMTFHGTGDAAIHVTQLECSAALLNRGVPVDEVVETLVEASRAAGEHGASWDWDREERDLRDMCTTWLKKHPEVAEKAGSAKEADQLAGFHFDGVGSIEPEPRLIDDLLSTSGLTLIGGQSGAGKTFLVIMMMVCLAEKKPFFGREVRERVGTLYVAGEGQGAIAARIAAAKDAVGLESDRKLPIAWLDTPPPLDTPQKVDAFVAKLRALDARFQQDHGVRLGAVILDTASACFDLKDENDNAEVARICKAMQRVAAGFGGVVVPVHHYGKVLEAGPRGASAWRGNVEIILGALADVDQLTGDVKSRELAVAKNRDGAQGPVAPFTLEFTVLGTTGDGRDFGACFVKPNLGGESRFGKARKRKAPRSETALRDAATEALDSLGANKTLRAGGPVVRAVAVEHVRVEFNRRYVVDEEDPLKAARAKRVAFNRALTRLPAEFGMGEFGGTQWVWRA